MSYYSSQGYSIFVPVDSGRIDFIACKDEEVIKVQVKTAAKRRRGTTVYTVGILSSRRGGGSTGPYRLGEIDECFVVGEGTAWRIPYSIVYPNVSVMLESNKDRYIPRHNFPVEFWRVAL